MVAANGSGAPQNSTAATRNAPMIQSNEVSRALLTHLIASQAKISRDDQARRAAFGQAG